MAEFDIEALLLPVSGDAPAGPDLSYDAERQAIEHAFGLSPDEVDWDATTDRIIAQAAATRDLWLAVYLARAGAQSGKLEMVENGLALLAGYVEGFWDTAYPTIEEYGIEGRKGACESLVRIGEFLAPLRRVPLIEHPRIGGFSGEDFERFAAEGATADGYGQFRAAIAESSVERIAELLDRLGRIRAAVERADAVLSVEADRFGQTGTNFSRTYEVIGAIADAVRPYVTQDPLPAGGVAPPAPAAAPERSDAKSSGVGRIENREDVARALDAIVEYYGRTEPSSPIPVAIGRIKGWIAMDFVAILNDIAPGSVGEALNVLRAKTEDERG